MQFWVWLVCLLFWAGVAHAKDELCTFGTDCYCDCVQDRDGVGNNVSFGGDDYANTSCLNIYGANQGVPMDPDVVVCRDWERKGFEHWGWCCVGGDPTDCGAESFTKCSADSDCSGVGGTCQTTNIINCEPGGGGQADNGSGSQECSAWSAYAMTGGDWGACSARTGSYGVNSEGPWDGGSSIPCRNILHDENSEDFNPADNDYNCGNDSNPTDDCVFQGHQSVGFQYIPGVKNGEPGQVFFDALKAGGKHQSEISFNPSHDGRFGSGEAVSFTFALKWSNSFVQSDLDSSRDDKSNNGKFYRIQNDTRPHFLLGSKGGKFSSGDCYRADTSPTDIIVDNSVVLPSDDDSPFCAGFQKSGTLSPPSRIDEGVFCTESGDDTDLCSFRADFNKGVFVPPSLVGDANPSNPGVDEWMCMQVSIENWCTNTMRYRYWVNNQLVISMDNINAAGCSNDGSPLKFFQWEGVKSGTETCYRCAGTDNATCASEETTCGVGYRILDNFHVTASATPIPCAAMGFFESAEVFTAPTISGGSTAGGSF